MCKSNSGFTLIEFLVSIVILMVGLLGLLQAVNVSIHHNMNSQIRLEAVSVADQALAKELAKTFDNVSTTTSTYLVSRQVVKAFKNFSVVRTGTLLTNSKQVNVRVSWKNKGNHNSHETSSVVSKNQ